MEGPLKCPVCQARFRGSVQCSRCGADLEPLMRLAAVAYRLRQAARCELESGNLDTALTLASEAESLCSTTHGERIRRLALLLA